MNARAVNIAIMTIPAMLNVSLDLWSIQSQVAFCLTFLDVLAHTVSPVWPEHPPPLLFSLHSQFLFTIPRLALCMTTRRVILQWSYAVMVNSRLSLWQISQPQRHIACHCYILHWQQVFQHASLYLSQLWPPPPPAQAMLNNLCPLLP